MPPSIPFLRLPNDPQLLIFEYMSLGQLFDFSLLSKRANKIAKSAKRNVAEFFWDDDYRNGTFSLRITDYEKKGHKKRISLEDRMNAEEITLEGRTLRREDYERKVSIDGENLSKEDLSELFDKLTEHFLTMLNVEYYSVNVTKAADLAKCSLFKYTKTLKELHVRTDEVLPARDMEFILGELTVTGRLMIQSDVAEGFEWTEPLKTEEIHLNDGLSLSLDVYLKSEVKEWRFYDDTLPSTHLNAIIKKWLDGGLEQLKSFEMVILSNDRERRLNEALEGIQTFPWDKRTRQSKYYWFNTSEGRDMWRDDWKLATAGVRGHCFYFVVWDSDELRPE